MEAYILTGVGIIVSVALFLITYRQTIGAKKERVAAANAMLERTLLRRIVQEGYRPIPQEIEILIDGFAREHRVKDTDLMSVEETLNVLYTRVASTDLIHSESRAEILNRILQGIAFLEGSPIQMQQATLDELEHRFNRVTWLSTTGLAVITSLAGTLIAVYPLIKTRSFPSVTGLLSSNAILIFLASLGIIFIVMFVFRLRERSEEPSGQAGLQRAVDFQREVTRMLRKHGAKAMMQTRDSGYDFEIEEGGKRVLLLLKAWGQRVPLGFQRQTIDRLRTALKQTDADEAWIIVRDKSAIPHSIDEPRIKFFTLDEFRNNIAHNSAQ